MTNQELQKLLEQLHHEIENTKSVDEKGIELLQSLEDEIRELLEHSGKGPLNPQPSTLRYLEDAIDHLEVTHPTLTMALSEILAILSNAGI